MLISRVKDPSMDKPVPTVHDKWLCRETRQAYARYLSQCLAEHHKFAYELK